MNEREVISRFLEFKALPDMAALYGGPDSTMEVQVMPDSRIGEQVEPGKQVYQHEGTTFYPIRIPNSTGEDKEARFPLLEYARRVGMTGWDYSGVSKHVGYDFDSLIGHSALIGLSSDQLNVIKTKIREIPWVESRYSKGGSGLHLRVYFANRIPTASHDEHANLALVIGWQIGEMIGVDFVQQADCIGSILWVWDKDAAPNAFQKTDYRTIEPYPADSMLPDNWREVAASIQSRVSMSRTRRQAEYKAVPLSTRHQELISWLRDNGHFAGWDESHNILRVHTSGLRAAHEALKLRGDFATKSDGREPFDFNCWASPRSQGWYIERYGTEVEEDWRQSSKGKSSCYFDQPVSLHNAAAKHKGMSKQGVRGYTFDKFENACAALRMMGVEVTVHTPE